MCKDAYNRTSWDQEQQTYAAGVWCTCALARVVSMHEVTPLPLSAPVLVPLCVQYASVAIWMYEDYYTYSAVVLVITIASIVTNVISQYKVRSIFTDVIRAYSLSCLPPWPPSLWA